MILPCLQTKEIGNMSYLALSSVHSQIDIVDAIFFAYLDFSQGFHDDCFLGIHHMLLPQPHHFFHGPLSHRFSLYDPVSDSFISRRLSLSLHGEWVSSTSFFWFLWIQLLSTSSSFSPLFPLFPLLFSLIALSQHILSLPQIAAFRYVRLLTRKVFSR